MKALWFISFSGFEALEVDESNGDVYWSEKSVVNGQAHNVLKSRVKFREVTECWGPSTAYITALLITPTNRLIFLQENNIHSVSKMTLPEGNNSSMNTEAAPAVSLAIRNGSSVASEYPGWIGFDNENHLLLKQFISRFMP